MRISDWSSDVCSSDLVEDPAHREKMLERFLLQCSHHLMRLVDRLGDARSITMFGFNRLREPDIGGAHPELKCPATTREISFDPFELRFLRCGPVELRSEERRVGKEWFSTCRIR